MSDPRFDSHVPIPPPRPRWTWDFRAMQVGDSVFVPHGTVENRWASERARQALYAANRRWRGQGEWRWQHVEGGIRIWRVK